MLIREILAELKKENQTVSSIAKMIDGISEKPLRRALQEAGYKYSNQAPKGWKFIEEGEEPLDKSIFDYIKKNPRSTNVKRSSPSNKINVNTTSHKSEIKKNNSEVNSSSSENKENHNSHKSESKENKSDIDSYALHQKEVAATSDIAETISTAPSFTPEEVVAIKEMLEEWTNSKEKSIKLERLHERIKQLDSSDKQRRTIVIDRKVGSAFDQFCKEQRFNKSEIMELAMLDFIDKYS